MKDTSKYYKLTQYVSVAKFLNIVNVDQETRKTRKLKQNKHKNKTKKQEKIKPNIQKVKLEVSCSI